MSQTGESLQDKYVSNPLAPNSEKPYTHDEAEGDRLAQSAKRADIEQTNRDLWQAAEYAYLKALGALPRARSTARIILYRKVAATVREQGRIDQAKKFYLDKGWEHIQVAKAHPNDSAQLILEEAFYQLEYAYCAFKEEDWHELKHHTENLLKQFEHDRTLELHADFSYVIGCAYNLLAIALEQAHIPEATTKKNSLACWDIARAYLLQVRADKAQAILQNIEINRAPRLFNQGNCDPAIQILEGLLDTDLATFQRIIVQQTLAAAYLDRQADDDIAKANALAHKNLMWAQNQGDISEWVEALQLYLDVLRAKSEAEPQASASTLIEAEKALCAFHQASKLDSEWKPELDELELRRLLTELYLAAGQMREATKEFEFIEAHRPEVKRDAGDIYLTLAKFYQKKGELDDARNNLREARLRFQQAGHCGMVVETDLQWAKVEASQGKLVEAQERLEKTLKITSNLACKTRVERVLALQRDLPKLCPTSERSIITILFLASDPSGLPHLRFSEEFREIEEQLQLAKLREQFNLQSKIAVRIRDLISALLNLHPQIVHFSGHGVENGLYLENKVGEAQLASASALAALFKQFEQQINCVILNACYTENHAQAIAQHIPHVIGMSHAITDQASIAFSLGFYQALGAGRSIKDAFEFGCTQLRLEGITEDLLPILICREK